MHIDTEEVVSAIALFSVSVHEGLTQLVNNIKVDIGQGGLGGIKRKH